MRLLIGFMLLIATFVVVGGCAQKTPEEIEAAKYPQVKQNTPEQDKALLEKSSMHSMPGASGK